MTEATKLFTPAEPGSPQMALCQLIAGVLQIQRPPVHVTLDTLLSLYRHIVLQSPENYGPAITGLQAITAEIAERKHLVDLSNQMPASAPH